MPQVYEQRGGPSNPAQAPRGRYHNSRMKRGAQRKSKLQPAPPGSLPFDASLVTPGDRVGVAVSGGADSVALLRFLVEHRQFLGIGISVVHVQHGLRGDESRRDAEFVMELAERLDLPCERIEVDTRQRAAEHKETIEEAARHLRYQVFADCIAANRVDKVATAHTLDDQAETVLMKILRGAWTDGLSGIHPRLPSPDATGSERQRADFAVAGHGGIASGCIIRPLLAARRTQIEGYLRALGQGWREDATNRDPAFTRNRIRHELLPLLRSYNPQIDRLLAQMAANARAEETHWQAELARVLPLLLLPGRPARGGGRSVATQAGAVSLAMELARLQALDSGLRRRVLRAAAARCGAQLDFEQTEQLLRLVDASGSQGNAGQAHAGSRLELPGNVRAERSWRELRLWRQAGGTSAQSSASEGSAAGYTLPVPGAVMAKAFQAKFIATLPGPVTAPLPAARVRAWQDGDRVTLPHSRGPKKVKEILARLHISASERAAIPVVEWEKRIIWLRGVSICTDADWENCPQIEEVLLSGTEFPG